MLPHHPRVDAAGVDLAVGRDPLRQPEGVERGARAHDRDGAVGPAAGQVLGHHVERVGHDERDAGHLTGLDRGRDLVHDLEVAAQRVEAVLARGGVVPGGDDEDVLLLDAVRPEAADLDVRQERLRVEEVQREPARGVGGAAVHRHPACEAAHDDGRRGRHADTTRPHDPDPRSRHRRNLRGRAPRPSTRLRAATRATAPPRRPPRARAWCRRAAGSDRARSSRCAPARRAPRVAASAG